MDINEAALELARIEAVEAQLQHLRKEAEAGGFEYANQCNEKAQELIRMLLERQEGQPLPLMIFTGVYWWNK